MNIHSYWMSKFGEYSPNIQVIIMVGLATLSSNILASAFFFIFGFENVGKVMIGTTCVVILVSAPLGAFLVSLNFKMKQLAAQLDLNSRRDDLTGLSTRAEFYFQVQRQFQFGDPARSAGAILYIDADHFKRINDEHGHAIGDAVLQEIGIVLRSFLREWDYAARFGGEEFAIFLKGADIGKATWISHRILMATRGVAGQLGVDGLNVTVSIGVAIHAPGQTLDEVLISADQCLYSAKNQGRNRMVLAGISSAKTTD